MEKLNQKQEAIIVNGKRVQLLSNRNPEELPWKELNIDIVIEATGKFNSREKASFAFKCRSEKGYFNCSWKK